MNFRDFITENKEKHAVMAFGRMNPITTGHEVLINKVKDVAKEVGGSHHVIMSHSQDKDKNPLSPAQKLKHAKRFFPDTNVSTSDKESPTFLQHAAKLHKQGVTHLHMVAGSDRVSEYKKKLAQYNGAHKDALFNFKKITVHSAGKRDPDAEGTSGMSASKMRSHASSGKFKDFKKGIPSHVPEHHAKELYHDVRKGMQIKEDLNEEFELLSEGVHDAGIFKAVFLAGGPGSGKDYVLNNTLDGHGLTEINSDKAFEFLMDKKGLDKMMPSHETETRNLVRGRAKNVTELRQQLALIGRNGLIINGTGDNIKKTTQIKDQLEKLGYETSMLLVNTEDKISAERNIDRGKRGGRAVPENFRKEKWDSVQAARTVYAKMFGEKYIEFDNSEDLRSADPEMIRAKKQEMLELYKTFQDFVAQPSKTEESKFWIANELDKKDTLPVETGGVEKVPAHDDAVGTEASKLGLQYYGFGRYGKNGKVTHRSVNGNLILVNKEEPKQPKIPINSSSQKQAVKESFTNTNDIFTEKSSMLKSKNGKLRVFMLRNTAAKEAHTKNGTIIKHNNGYVVKLNGENKNAKLSEESIQIERTSHFSESSSGTNSPTSSSYYNSGRTCCCTTTTCNCGAKSTTEQTSGQEARSKIPFAEIRTRQKEKIIEKNYY